MIRSRTAVVAMFLLAVVVAATSVPAASAYGCFDDCYERCANGNKEDSACTTMCNEACGAVKQVVAGISAAAKQGAGVTAPAAKPAA